MNICQECDSKFPNYKKIDGEKRNLSSRKRCLDCSPFGEHNTKPVGREYPLDLECELCGKQYEYTAASGMSKTYCSECQIRRKRIAYKHAIISIKGGCCERCGYNNCTSALTAHHTDEKNIEFRNAYRRTYEDLAEELKNVELVCENCHTKEHCEGSRGYCPEHTWNKQCCTKDNPCDQSCYVMHLRHKRRLQFIEQKGGECKKCGRSGCTGAFSFHHRDPENKEFRLDVTAFSRSVEKLKNEVAKCDLLCHNCHQKHHCECEVKCGDMFEDYVERAEEQIRKHLS